MRLQLGDIVALEETYTPAVGSWWMVGQWRNYRLIKVMRTYNAGMDVLTYLPYPGGRVMQPHKRHRVITLSAWRKNAAAFWNHSNHFNDFSTFAGMVDEVRGAKIALPVSTRKRLPPPTPEAT